MLVLSLVVVVCSDGWGCHPNGVGLSERTLRAPSRVECVPSSKGHSHHLICFRLGGGEREEEKIGAVLIASRIEVPGLIVISENTRPAGENLA